MYLHIPVIYFCCLCWSVLLSCRCCRCSAAACVCCSSSCAGWHNLLLLFIASDAKVVFVWFQTSFIFNLPFSSTAVACACSLVLYIYYTSKYIITSSIITGMCGAKAGFRSLGQSHHGIQLRVLQHRLRPKPPPARVVRYKLHVFAVFLCLTDCDHIVCTEYLCRDAFTAQKFMVYWIFPRFAYFW